MTVARTSEPRINEHSPFTPHRIITQIDRRPVAYETPPSLEIDCQKQKPRPARIAPMAFSCAVLGNSTPREDEHGQRECREAHFHA